MIALLLLAALVAALLHSSGEDAWLAGGQHAAAPADAVAATHVRRGMALAGGRTVHGAVEPSAGRLQPAPAAQRRTRLGEGFEQADDLHAYLQALLPAAQTGDADAAWFASRVYDYCAAHATDPAAYARDTGALARMRLAASAPMIAARDRVAHRCRQFVPADGLGAGLVILQRLEAAEAGSLAAEAALLAMGEPLDDSGEYRSALVEQVQASADAQAFSALAPAMGLAASGDPALAGQVAGTTQAELAWHMAACALGLDCSAEGALMTSWCANGGVCSRKPHQDFPAFVRDAEQPRGGAKTINELFDSLLREGVPR